MGDRGERGSTVNWNCPVKGHGVAAGKAEGRVGEVIGGVISASI